MKGSLGIGQGGLLRTQPDKPDKQRGNFLPTAATTELLWSLGGEVKREKNSCKCLIHSTVMSLPVQMRGWDRDLGDVKGWGKLRCREREESEGRKEQHLVQRVMWTSVSSHTTSGLVHDGHRRERERVKGWGGLVLEGRVRGASVGMSHC